MGDWPPAPGSGGAACKINADCGIPAANCDSLREKCISETGHCDHGKCVCATNYYGCSNCAAKATLVGSPPNFQYSTEHEMLDGSHRKVDECSVDRGGKLCQTDFDCSARGGLCLAGGCVCPDSWLCDDCSITLTDMLYGLKCGVAKNGGGACAHDADCGNGRCEKTGGRPAYCACTALWGCEHCSAKVPDLVAGTATCPENAAFGIMAQQ